MSRESKEELQEAQADVSRKAFYSALLDGDPLIIVYRNGTWAPYNPWIDYITDDPSWPILIRYSIYFRSAEYSVRRATYSP